MTCGNPVMDQYPISHLGGGGGGSGNILFSNNPSPRYLMLQKAEIHPLSLIYMQHVKKVMSDS